MHLSLKVLIDHTIGRALCYGLFPFVRILGLLLRRDHNIRRDNVNVIAVAKYYGLGSIIHAMPMLRALKVQYPEAKLIFITRKNNQSLFANFRYVDEVLYVNDDSFLSLAISNIRLFASLIRRRVDLFFDLELFSAYGALVSLFSLARNRMGFFCGLETDFKTLLYTHLMYFNFQMPIRACYLQLARFADIASDASSDLVAPVIDDAIRTAARAKLNDMLSGTSDKRKLLAINVNASELLLERRWMLERFETVARHFAQHSYHILFVGSSEERPYVQKIVSRMTDMSDRIHNVAGRFTLSEFLALLQECDALLTSDAGIMNFAYALNLPTVSLWGPGDAKQYHIANAWTRAISKPVYCSPCIYRFYQPPCRGNNLCMSLIEVDEVVSALDSLLKGKQDDKRLDVPCTVSIDASGIPLGSLRSRSKSIEKGNTDV